MLTSCHTLLFIGFLTDNFYTYPFMNCVRCGIFASNAFHGRIKFVEKSHHIEVCSFPRRGRDNTETSYFDFSKFDYTRVHFELIFLSRRLMLIQSNKYKLHGFVERQTIRKILNCSNFRRNMFKLHKIRWKFSYRGDAVRYHMALVMRYVSYLMLAKSALYGNLMNLPHDNKFQQIYE